MSTGTKDDKTPFIIITGLSGSGKGTVLKAFEDIGYFCVDNLPLKLVPKFAEICSRAVGQISRAAIVVDVREGAEFEKFPRLFAKLQKMGLQIRLIFLEASNEVLIRRYSETRRPHPLTQDRPIAKALEEERRRLEPIRELRNTTIIDTSKFNVHELRDYIAQKFRGPETGSPLLISILSFGFKHGVPLESDLVFDVRFLPNPNFVRSLRNHNGNDKEVVSYIKSFKQTGSFFKYLSELLLFLIPQYIAEGKSYLTISVGCTGGRHRSVMVANEINRLLSGRGYQTKIIHRDFQR